MTRIKEALPKLCGVALVTVGFWYAIDPNWPIPLAHPQSSSAQPQVSSGPEVHSLTVDSQESEDEPRFLWDCVVEARQWRVVLLDEHRQEIAWSAPTDAKNYRPEGEFRDALARGRGRYWYAVGEASGRRLRSAASLVTPR